MRQRGVSRAIAAEKRRFSSKTRRLRRSARAPYSAPPSSFQPASRHELWTHASRYPQSLRKLARPHRHGRGHDAACRQFCGLGHQRHFSRLRPARRWRRSARPKSGIDQFRQTYDDRLQQIGRQLGHPLPPDQANALGLDRQVLGEMIAQAGLDQLAQKMGLGLSDTRYRTAHHVRSASAGSSTAISTARGFKCSCSDMGYERARLYRRTAADVLAPAARRQHIRRHHAAAGLARRHQSVPESTAQHRNMCRSARRKPATFRRRPTRTQQIFRRAQNPVPGAGIPQDRHHHGDAGGAGAMDADFRRRHQKGL